LRKVLFIFFLVFSTEALVAQLPLIDSLQHVASQHPRDTLGVKALLNLVFELSRKDSQKAKSYCYQVISQATPLKMTNGLEAAYAYLVTLHQNSGELDSAKHYLNVLQKSSKENPAKAKSALNYYQTAGLFYKNQGLYNQALPFMLEALKLNTGENENHAGQLLNVGNTYFNLGDLKNAARFHLQSLELFEKIKHKRGQSFCLNSLGNDFFKLNQFDQAEVYFQGSITIKTELEDKRGLISSWTGLADVYKEKDQFHLSEKYYQQALAASKEMKLLLEEARCYNQLGLLYKKMNDMPRARASLSSALQLSKQGGDSAMSATISSSLIVLNLKAKDEKLTENQLLTNLGTHINLGDRSEEATGYSNLANYYAKNKQFDKAYSYLEKYKAIQDSLSGGSIVLQIKQLEAQFEKEKKEKEIALLKKDKELSKLELSRERANTTIIIIALISVVIISTLLVNRYRVLNRTRRLVELERMRNTIARDLHDDIGSTLSSINIISQMALKDANGSTSHFQRIAQHSSSMMESMSDIVWSINPNNDSMPQVVSKMKEFASEILDPLDIIYTFSGEEDLQETKLDVSTRKNLFLIFKEAINNAAKYSMANTIQVRFKKEHGKLSLSIQDNGKGFAVHSTTSGNGMRNMKERAAGILGNLEVRTSPNSGTAIVLVLPIT
jgi:two-component system sensor histidine kinase UhpB